ncbi:TRAP transporter small permease subunit [bacterium]|nr:TRAP transporter small permease subunit [bacterium]
MILNWFVQQKLSACKITKKIKGDYLKFLIYYVKIIDSLNEKIGKTLSWLTLLLVLLVCYDVFVRYLLKQSSSAIQELEWHIFSILFLLTAAFTLKEDKHVRVDVFYANFSPKKKALVDFLGCVFFLIPFSILMIWSSQNFVLTSFKINEVSPDPGGLPARFLLKSMIPIGFFLVLLQGFSMLFKIISGNKKND